MSFFGINSNILIKEKLFLSGIREWHAHAVEFSILFSNKGYKTFYLPIYVEHNSKRTNNYNLYQTHDYLSNMYKTNKYTLCGRVANFIKYPKIKRWIYKSYVKKIKYKYNNVIINKPKYFF